MSGLDNPYSYINQTLIVTIMSTDYKHFMTWNILIWLYSSTSLYRQYTFEFNSTKSSFKRELNT